MAAATKYDEERKEGALTAEELERLQAIEADVEILYDSLVCLFEKIPVISKTPSSTSPQEGGVTEDGLKQFRSRVARRIYFYGPQIREYMSIYERLPQGLERTRAEKFYRHHLESLQK